MEQKRLSFDQSVYRLTCDQAIVFFFFWPAIKLFFSFFWGGGRGKKKIRVVFSPRQKKKSPDRRLLWSLSPALRNLWLLLVLNSHFLCLSCPSAFFALQQGGFVPREWLVAKGLIHCLLLFTLLTLAILHFMSLCFKVQVKSLYPSNLFIMRLYLTFSIYFICPFTYLLQNHIG